jgi:hypothetical protein
MLIGNGLRLGSNPMRYLDGQVAYTQHRCLQLTPGGMRGFYNGNGTTAVTRKAAFPCGYNHTTGAWIMPPKGGDMGASRVTLADATLAGGMFTGVRISVITPTVGVSATSATLTYITHVEMSGTTSATVTGNTSTLSYLTIVQMSGTTTATVTGNTSRLNQIVSISGASTALCSSNSTLVGIGTLVGTGTGHATATATVRGQGNLNGTTAVTVSTSTSIRAVGNLEGHVTPFTELSPENLASAVWSETLESTYSAKELMRLVAAVQAGDATAMNTAPVFMALDGSKSRIEGTLSGSGGRTITVRDVS